MSALHATKVGDKAPDFSLKDQSGKTVKLSSYQGIFGKPVVLYFYPADASPGCTKQAKAFTDAIGEFKKAGATVVGVSGDDVESHQKFKSELGIPFQLLADEGNEVRKTYGVKKDLLGLLEGRQTYVIGKDGIVKLVFNNQWEPEKHVDEALKALA
ncbi:alkyl hydroperoxide reductase/ thiol specific antioxidant/ Mal allergen [Coccomyxa subellipsoidea C-169]|uniref:Thioredoxin peroxidase n=1 Tax=Coccomyxa subellipsoidea (strain C-169) TaxID=574566 RepID=I0Z1E9_COCSC|nr:alkyl hydroperoxide reductase/ thiol specific antioxidant/ Mal allergen [Coccomyxa subellipsoidea C-169]EIE24468.1 alkyl hydroperoxide reductase/ thiol specific antioxidant/ Mal allergen [Coccomyxa subellipsoidea C-169]|eukprot:XP_005649012.1 alkyl hydroperoxide reductase/ thiol specific antioxidant/ Mal allergen [Coccomyxa subellipsoidea C-169]